MKLEPQEYNLLFEFLNNADFGVMIDDSDKQILRLERLRKSGLTFSSGGDIMSFDIPNTQLIFPFEDYEIMGRNMIYFFKKDGYILSVQNYKNGDEIIQELELLK